MLKYACGNEVMVGDTVLRLDSNGGFLAVGEYVVKTIQHNTHSINLESEGEYRTFDPEFFNLISRKGETTMKTKQFTKADLKTGMVVELRNGDRAMVLLGTESGNIISGQTWFPLAKLLHDLSHDSVGGREYDVVKVYQPPCNSDYLGLTPVWSHDRIIWEREAPKSEEQIAYDEAVEATEAARKAYELAQKKLEALNPSGFSPANK